MESPTRGRTRTLNSRACRGHSAPVNLNVMSMKQVNLSSLALTVCLFASSCATHRPNESVISCTGVGVRDLYWNMTMERLEKEHVPPAHTPYDGEETRAAYSKGFADGWSFGRAQLYKGTLLPPRDVKMKEIEGMAAYPDKKPYAAGFQAGSDLCDKLITQTDEDSLRFQKKIEDRLRRCSHWQGS